MLRRLLIPSLTIAVTGAVPVAMHSASDGGGIEPPQSDQSHRRHLRGEPQLRQLVWIVGRCQRPAQRAAGQTGAGEPGRDPILLSEAERCEPDIAAAFGDLHRLN